MIEGWKTIKLLEAILFDHQKNNKEADRLCIKFSWNPNTRVPKFSFSTYPFSVAHYFRRYLNFFQIRINKMVNSVNTLVLQDLSQGYILSYFFKVLRVLPLSRMLVEFCLRLVYSTMCGKLSRKCTESTNFYSCCPPSPPHPQPPPTQNSPPSQSKKYEDDLEHSVIYIFHDLKFFQMWWLYGFVDCR